MKRLREKAFTISKLERRFKAISSMDSASHLGQKFSLGGMLATLLKDISFSAVTLKHMACAQRDLAQLFLLDPDVLEEHPKDITRNEDCATCGRV